MCLRKSRIAVRLGAVVGDEVDGVGRHHVDDVAERGGGGGGRPANTASRSPNSHGRPRQPRPIDDTVAAGRRIIASASAATQMSPLPSTGIGVDVGLELADGVPAGVAGVVLLGRAGVQGDVGDALVLADGAGAQVGEQVVAQAHAELGRDRHAVRRRRRDGGADDRRSSAGLAGTAAPPPRRVTLAAGQPKLRSTWSTRPSIAQRPTARPSSPGRSRRAAGCAAARRARTSPSARSSALPWTSAVAITISLT